jgi:predicted Zn-dependent protease
MVEGTYQYVPEQIRPPIADMWQMLDGLVYGDEAAAGIVRDETFYNSTVRVVVSFPKGWVVSWSNSKVTGRAPGGSGQGRITLQRQNEVVGQDPEEYVTETLKRDDVTEGESLEVNGYETYVAKVKAQDAGAFEMIAVVFKDGAVYYFKGEADAGTDGTAFEKDFRATVGSLRAMVKDDLNVANRQRIKVVEAVPGDTYRKLATRSSLKSHAEELLRLLNGDHPLGEPRPGDPIKQVQ